MKKLWLILTAVVLLLSCGNRAKSDLPLSDVEEGWGERYQKELEDSLAREKALHEETTKESAKPMSISSSSGSSGVHSSSDNMRGFDPASEDDMEDNGMRRFMENNDEEGWN